MVCTRHNSGVTPRVPLDRLLATTLALLLGFVAMATVSQLLAPFDIKVAMIVGELALLVPVVLTVAAFSHSLGPGLAIRPVTRRSWALAVPCGVAFWVLSAGVIETQSLLWAPPPEVLEAFRSLHSGLHGVGPGSLLATLTAVAIAPACAEEIAFRGALLGALEEPFGAAGAVVLSALVFGATHMVPGGYRIPFALLLGVALGLLRLRTGSVAPGIIAHALVNAITVVLTPTLDGPTRNPSLASTTALGLLAAGMALSSVLIAACTALTSKQPTG
jgi:membrane protease YdiL (CAAX protease family)